MAGSNSNGFAAAQVRYEVTRLGGGVTSQGAQYPGGLDLTTPSLSLQAGALRDCLNFEVSQTGGYARIAGYERVDGQPKPSDANYIIVQVSAFTNLPAAGDSILQAGSGATGVVAAVNNVAGSYYMVVTKNVGAFNYTGAITVGATPIGTAISNTAIISTLQNAQYLNAAADIYRDDIGAVPGGGDILGVVGMVFNGVDNIYAFRADAPGTTVLLYKASAAGWVLVPFFDTVQFTTGAVAEPADGATLTQGGVTATIKRVQTASGTYAGATAAGQLVITDVAGGNFAAGAATATGGVTLVLTGAETPITFTPGGRFQFDKGNFSGQLATRRIYGCDNVNRAFEFDGETVAPINSGLTTDAPTNICCHKNMLFLSYASSIIYSGPGTPTRFLPVDGGGEIATGDVVTGLMTLPGDQSTATLGVYLRSNTAILYGTDSDSFNFVSINTGTGALQYTAQNLFDTFIFDDLGVVTTRTSLNFGNFSPSTLTKNILPFIAQQRRDVCASSINHSKGQYRVWFSSGYGLWLTTVNQQFMGASLVYFPNPVAVAGETDLANGGMTSYFGSSDGLGFVYELDQGTSFDGENIDAYITMAWDPVKTPRILKRWRAASIEMQGDAYAAISFGYLLGYGSLNIGQPANQNYFSGFSGPPIWDQSMVWDSFVWDGRTLMPTEVDMVGTAENVQFIISSTTDYIAAFNINSIISHYTLRRGMRN